MKQHMPTSLSLSPAPHPFNRDRFSHSAVPLLTSALPGFPPLKLQVVQ